MHVVRFEDAPAYEAPGHHATVMRRLQGREAGPADTVWLGCSDLAPGAEVEWSASASEKFYVVLQGEVEVSGGPEASPQTVVLKALDSCRIAPGEPRRLHNRSKRTATVMLVMAIA